MHFDTLKFCITNKCTILQPMYFSIHELPHVSALSQSSGSLHQNSIKTNNNNNNNNKQFTINTHLLLCQQCRLRLQSLNVSNIKQCWKHSD